MRIRELYFRNFRSFRGKRTISFIEPLTTRARALTVLAGSNGSGKTTASARMGSKSAESADGFFAST